MHESTSLFDDITLLMTLVSISCRFDAGQRCEVKWQLDGAHGHEGQFRIQTVSAAEAERLKPGDVYGLHIRRL